MEKVVFPINKLPRELLERMHQQIEAKKDAAKPVGKRA